MGLGVITLKTNMSNEKNPGCGWIFVYHIILVPHLGNHYLGNSFFYLNLNHYYITIKLPIQPSKISKSKLISAIDKHLSWLMLEYQTSLDSYESYEPWKNTLAICCIWISSYLVGMIHLPWNEDPGFSLPSISWSVRKFVDLFSSLLTTLTYPKKKAVSQSPIFRGELFVSGREKILSQFQ